ncbi:MAG: hypothetical protein Fur0041_21920 [Bacteroidia bacterium]
MDKKLSRNIRLGIFVVLGTFFMVVGLYMLGDRQSMFSSTITLKTYFSDVNGLMAGNEVRLSGINIGTIESVDINNDTSVVVTLRIEEDAARFIHKNCIAKVGTDGLMGNKLINLNNPDMNAPVVEDGDILKADEGVDMDVVMKTLDATNTNIKLITDDLKSITDKLNKSSSLWQLLGDTVLADNLENAVVNIKVTGQRTAVIAGDLSKIVKDVKDGKGAIGALVTDTSLANQVKQTVVDIKFVSNKMAVVTGDMAFMTNKMKDGQGSVGRLIMDTTFVHNLNAGLKSVNMAATGFSDNMEALKHTWPLKKYYRRRGVK